MFEIQRHLLESEGTVKSVLSVAVESKGVEIALEKSACCALIEMYVFFKTLDV